MKPRCDYVCMIGYIQYDLVFLQLYCTHFLGGAWIVDSTTCKAHCHTSTFVFLNL